MLSSTASAVTGPVVTIPPKELVASPGAVNFGFSLTVTSPVADQERVSVATALVGVSKAVPTVLIDAPSEAARSRSEGVQGQCWARWSR